MSISVGGLVSGLDTNSIIEQLLTLQQRPIVTLQQREAGYQVKLSAYGSLQSTLSSLKSAMEDLESVSDLTSFSATSADTDKFTVSASASAAAGSYNITVEQLALAHKLKSMAAFTETEEVGVGTIHLEIGNVFTIDSNNNKINFLEVGGTENELTATLDSGTYTISELETEIKTKLDAADGSAATHTVSYDNSTQKFTIAGSGGGVTQIQYLWTTGESGNSVASTIGFTANDTGALSYTADNEVGTVHDISISATDTIQDVADAINDADAGVQAAVIFDGTDYYLTLTAEDSGKANVITLMVTDIKDGNNTDENGLSRLYYDPNGTTNRLSRTQEAKNSIIYVDGILDINRATNTIDDVIEGVTITLKDVHTVVPEPDFDTLTVSRNTSAIVSKVNSFVSAYNAVLDFFDTYQSYNPGTETAGVLLGDATTNSIRNRLWNMVTDAVPGVESFNRLADLGVTLNDGGQLEVDSSTLDDALDDHFDDVVQFFTQSTEGSEGFAVRMVDALDAILKSTDGTLAARTDGIQNSIDDIQDQVERIGMRISAWETRTRAQFQALEVLLAQYQVTGDYLSQQILGLQNLNSYISRLG
ncbi:MAG: flagellar filament capping protein FliD [Desulfobacterales bacterium]|nr:flagellar filament capping protein FliD [Desulfobacterales bacterium]